MSQLMLNDLGNTLLALNRGGGGIVQKVDDTIGNKTPVLHGTSREVGNSDHVHLWQRILDVECLFVEFEGLGSNVEGEVGILLVAGSSVDADGQTEIVGLLVAQVSNNECQKLSLVRCILPNPISKTYICRHQWGLVEGNRLLAVAHVLLLLHVHVGQACKVLVSNQCDGPGGLQVRLVEARCRL
jgi:hypothetical protein